MTNVVTTIDAATGRRLYDALGAEDFAFRRVEHAWWAAKGQGASVVFYRSGKLVVQGPGAEAFAQRFLPGIEPGGARPEPDAVDGPTIGSDESGKGDYFGPLVVAAALVRPEDVPELRRAGVQDSKAASDGTIRRLEGALRGRLPHHVEVLEPEAYNRAYAEEPNVNRLLGRLHARSIDAVLAQAPDAAPGAVHVVVDRFGDPDHVRRHLSEAARRCPFVMKVRGESHPAVAAASFLARAAFLASWERLRADAGGVLPLGASDPRIVPVAAQLLREGGEAWLGRFAKLHFRVTEKARGRTA